MMWTEEVKVIETLSTAFTIELHLRSLGGLLESMQAGTRR